MSSWREIFDLKSVKCTTLFIIVVATICGTEQRQDNAIRTLKTVSFTQSHEVPLDQNPHHDVPGALKSRQGRTGNVTRSRKAINDGANKEDLRKNFFNIGMRQDPKLQDCQNSELKTTFPDIDYTLLGYNILYGFPMTAGHDPGFTYPIFKADYSTGRQTADCRYSVPNGLVVIPDVACVISFSSTTIQNSHDYDEALSVSASVSVGGWGLSFSASSGYKKEISEIDSGESVLILSAASCHYYFSKIIPDQPPPFDDVFLQWLYKLNTTYGDPDLYSMFFDTYGTHFPTEVTFGARFTYEFKMSSKTYETKRSQGVDVAVQASYAGLFSAGGGFNMDSSQRQAASDFSKNVTTKTITVGAAPPANGDAMTWASEVKDNPVPTSFKLSSIEQLFSERYMRNLNIDYKRIGNLIATNKNLYCQNLLKLGKVGGCGKIDYEIKLNNTVFGDATTHHSFSSASECVDGCRKRTDCGEISYLTLSSSITKCNYYNNKLLLYAKEFKQAVSIVFPNKIGHHRYLNDTAVVGIFNRFQNDNDRHASLEKCEGLCIENAYCVAFSHCDCPTETAQCKLFSKEQINGLRMETGTTTSFISR